MMRRPPRSTRTDTLFPYTTLFRSQADGDAVAIPLVSARPGGEAQDIGLGQRLAFDIAEHPVQRRVLVEIAAAIDDAVAGAMLQGNAPLPPRILRHDARIGHRRMDVRGLERDRTVARSEEHTSELQSLMRISSAVLSLK